MSSVAFICNLALSNIGKVANVQDIADPTAEAKACKLHYDFQRRVILESYPWRFAGNSATLASLSSNPKSDFWAYAFRLPSDCLKPRRVLATNASYPEAFAGDFSEVYAIEGTSLYANVDPAYLDYTRDLTDASVFPPSFAWALSWYLAAAIAVPMTRDTKVRDDAMRVALAARDIAAAKDGNDAHEQTPRVGAFDAARE